LLSGLVIGPLDPDDDRCTTISRWCCQTGALEALGVIGSCSTSTPIRPTSPSLRCSLDTTEPAQTFHAGSVNENHRTTLPPVTCGPQRRVSRHVPRTFPPPWGWRVIQNPKVNAFTEIDAETRFSEK
jgi:hypothetical protein